MPDEPKGFEIAIDPEKLKDLFAEGAIDPDEPGDDAALAEADPETPPAEKPAVAAEPEPKAAVTAEASVRDLLAEVSKTVGETMREVAREGLETEPADPNEPNDDDDEVTDLRKENARLKVEAEQKDASAEVARIEHEIKSCVGKYGMSKQELEMTVVFFDENPTLEKVWSFERAALYVLPELKARLKSAPGPAATERPGGAGKALPVARGGASPAPAPRKTFAATPGSLEDVGEYLRSKAGSLGLFTNS